MNIGKTMKTKKIDKKNAFINLGIATVGVAFATAMISHGLNANNLDSFDKGVVFLASAAIGLPSVGATFVNCFNLLNEYVDELIYKPKSKTKLKI